MSSINSVVMIGGFVVLFCVIISILNNSGILQFMSTLFAPLFNILHIDTNYIKPIFSGLVELTNGVNLISQIPTKSLSTTIIITSFLLGCGGISILLQVLSITSKSDISIKPYIIGKILHGLVAAFFTYLLIHIFPIFSLDITPISSQNVNTLYSIPSNFNVYFSIVLACVAFLVFLFYCKRKTHIRQF